jgi:hypothetical protein
MGVFPPGGGSPNAALDKQADSVSIELLLVSGKRQRFIFPKGDTIGQVKEIVWDNWPEVCCLLVPPSEDARPLNRIFVSYLSQAWQDERPKTLDRMRL